MYGFIYPAIDEYGNKVKRTKDKYPYSYDGFIIARLLPNEERNNTLYTDRLYTRYKENWKLLLKKYFNETGDYFYQRNPNIIELFLKELLNKPDLKLMFIMEYCNASNGYPVWRFDVKM